MEAAVAAELRRLAGHVGAQGVATEKAIQLAMPVYAFEIATLI